MSRFCKKYTRLHIVESMFEVEQLHLHICLGHGSDVFTQCVYIGIPAYPII